MLYLTWKEILYMADYDFNSIFEQINNLKKPTTQTEEVCPEKDELREVLNSVSDEIKRVMNENNFTQEDLCRITGMSQSNISKILNPNDTIDVGSEKLDEYQERFQKQVEKISEVNKAALAEYVAHRRIILDLLKREFC